MSDPLADLAAAAGIAVRSRDAFGRPHEAPPPTLRAVLAAVGLPAATDAEVAGSLASLRRPPALPLLVTAEVGEAAIVPAAAGRFRLRLESGGSAEGVFAPDAAGRMRGPVVTEPGYHHLQTPTGEVVLAVAPPRCCGPRDLVSDLATGRLWGLSVPLYGLRREGDGGLGDYTALAQLATAAGARGAAALAISPVHAAFAADPGRFSPYSPSSRQFLNVLYIDPDHLPFDLPASLSPAGSAGAPAGPLIDWPAAGGARLRRLRTVFDAFAAAPEPARAAFAAFRAARGETLERHARFEALHAHFPQQDLSLRDWQAWPAPYRDPASPEVAAFAAAHATEVEFHAFLQFLADAGLAAAQAAARAAGMAIGLISDLAVGTDRAGSHAWSHRGEMLPGLTIGAPPDPLNAIGQDWGLTGFSPAGLRAGGYGGFIEMLRAALRHAGGVRIDHVMGLRRLWVIPEGASPQEGAYLTFPETDLLRLVVLESWRHRAIVLGEDLGTVPEGFREGLRRVGVMGLRLLIFEHENGRFIPPGRWPRDSVAMTTTHDLPTISGWWQERDIDWWERLGHANAATAARQRADRGKERHEMWAAFQASGAAAGPEPARIDGTKAADAACAHLGSTAADLALLPIEDALALEEQPNLPGTTNEHPNWRRRMPAPAGVLLDAPAVERRLAALARNRRAS